MLTNLTVTVSTTCVGVTVLLSGGSPKMRTTIGGLGYSARAGAGRNGKEDVRC